MYKISMSKIWTVWVVPITVLNITLKTKILCFGNRNRIYSCILWSKSTNMTHPRLLTTFTLKILIIINFHMYILYISMYLMHSIKSMCKYIISHILFSNDINNWKLCLLLVGIYKKVLFLLLQNTLGQFWLLEFILQQLFLKLTSIIISIIY